MLGIMNCGGDEPPEFFACRTGDNTMPRKSSRECRTYSTAGRSFINGIPVMSRTPEEMWGLLIVAAMKNKVTWNGLNSEQKALVAASRWRQRTSQAKHSVTDSLASTSIETIPEEHDEDVEEREEREELDPAPTSSTSVPLPDIKVLPPTEEDRTNVTIIEIEPAEESENSNSNEFSLSCTESASGERIFRRAASKRAAPPRSPSPLAEWRSRRQRFRRQNALLQPTDGAFSSNEDLCQDSGICSFDDEGHGRMISPDVFHF